MLNFSHQTRVFLCTSPVDMRKSFRGLCTLAESLLEKDPAGQDWFVFVNRRADRMKLLGWDGRGFWIWYMHLEAGTFQTPTKIAPTKIDCQRIANAQEGSSQEATHLEMDVTQLSLIINGIDLRSAKRRTRYQAAG